MLFIIILLMCGCILWACLGDVCCKLRHHLSRWWIHGHFCAVGTFTTRSKIVSRMIDKLVVLVWHVIPDQSWYLNVCVLSTYSRLEDMLPSMVTNCWIKSGVRCLWINLNIGEHFTEEVLPLFSPNQQTLQIQDTEITFLTSTKQFVQ